MQTRSHCSRRMEKENGGQDASGPNSRETLSQCLEQLFVVLTDSRMRSDGDAKKVIATATADHTKHGLEATIWRRDSSRMPLVDWLRVPVEVYSTYVGGGDPRKNGTPLPRVGRYLICKIIRLVIIKLGSYINNLE